MKVTVFWDDVPCSLVETGRRFRGAYCLHHQGNDRDYMAQHPRRQSTSLKVSFSRVECVALVGGRGKFYCTSVCPSVDLSTRLKLHVICRNNIY
jgi:hypothetical protein